MSLLLAHLLPQGVLVLPSGRAAGTLCARQSAAFSVGRALCLSLHVGRARRLAQGRRARQVQSAPVGAGGKKKTLSTAEALDQRDAAQKAKAKDKKAKEEGLAKPLPMVDLGDLQPIADVVTPLEAAIGVLRARLVETEKLLGHLGGPPAAATSVPAAADSAPAAQAVQAQAVQARQADASFVVKVVGQY